MSNKNAKLIEMISENLTRGDAVNYELTVYHKSTREALVKLKTSIQDQVYQDANLYQLEHFIDVCLNLDSVIEHFNSKFPIDLQLDDSQSDVEKAYNKIINIIDDICNKIIGERYVVEGWDSKYGDIIYSSTCYDINNALEAYKNISVEECKYKRLTLEDFDGELVDVIKIYDNGIDTDFRNIKK